MWNGWKMTLDITCITLEVASSWGLKRNVKNVHLRCSKYFFFPHPNAEAKEFGATHIFYLCCCEILICASDLIFILFILFEFISACKIFFFSRWWYLKKFFVLRKKIKFWDKNLMILNKNILFLFKIFNLRLKPSLI